MFEKTEQDYTRMRYHSYDFTLMINLNEVVQYNSVTDIRFSRIVTHWMFLGSFFVSLFLTSQSFFNDRDHSLL